MSHWIQKFVSGEPINHREFLEQNEKDRNSGRNIVAWIATRATIEAIRNREDEWSETAFWPKYSLASDLLQLQIAQGPLPVQKEAGK